MSSIRDRNLARELVEAVSDLERENDRLRWALRGMVEATEGMDGKARAHAVILLDELKERCDG